MNKIGFTTSIPVEVIYAANKIPVDLNNIFISDLDIAKKYVYSAELKGLPRSSCGWIKGMYSVVTEHAKDFEAIISVIEGDCSQSHALTELWEDFGVKTIPFSYPYARNKERLKEEINKLIDTLGTNIDEVERQKKYLDKIRSRVAYFDELTYKKGNISGFLNHLYLVSTSDFNSDPELFLKEINQEIEKSEKCPKKDNFLRLGYIGVPPIITGIYDLLETYGAKIVYNEVARQFSMPYKTDNIYDQYNLFTYPYDIFTRIDDIKNEIKKRKLDGIIHYTQSFCFRQIQDILIQKHLDIPVLTIEADNPDLPDERTKIRLESFVEMLTF